MMKTFFLAPMPSISVSSWLMTRSAAPPKYKHQQSLGNNQRRCNYCAKTTYVFPAVNNQVLIYTAEWTGRREENKIVPALEQQKRGFEPGLSIESAAFYRWASALLKAVRRVTLEMCDNWWRGSCVVTPWESLLRPTDITVGLGKQTNNNSFSSPREWCGGRHQFAFQQQILRN